MASYQQLVIQVARQYGIPVNVALAQINQESGFSPTARSSAGAEGIAQFMPGTAAEYGVSNPFDPVQALQGYGKMMSGLIRQYGLAGALSAYNSGNPNAYKDPNFARGQTYNYVRDILGRSGTGPQAYGSTPVTGGQPTGSVPSQGFSQPSGGPSGGMQMPPQPPDLRQHIVTSKLNVLGQSLATELLSQSSTLASGGTPDLKNLFTLAKGYQTARKAGPPPLGGTQLAQQAGQMTQQASKYEAQVEAL